MARSLLLSCAAASKAYGTRSLFEELSFGLFEGDQVGLVGPNGSGKSTLLKILAGPEPCDGGTRSVRGGGVPQDPVLPTDPAQSLRRALAPEGDTVTFQGRSVHVASWAKRFLIRPERLATRAGRSWKPSRPDGAYQMLPAPGV